MSMTDSDLWILSYDVDGHARATSVRVGRLIFGRRNPTTREGNPATYEQPGFIHRPGVVWVGQSVLILPRKDAYELRDRLEGLGASVGLGRLVIDGANLDAFRRRRRRGRRARGVAVTRALPRETIHGRQAEIAGFDSLAGWRTAWPP